MTRPYPAAAELESGLVVAAAGGAPVALPALIAPPLARRVMPAGGRAPIGVRSLGGAGAVTGAAPQAAP